MHLDEEQIVEALGPLEPVLVYLFGSQASGQSRSESDVDIAFLSQKRHDPYEVFLASQDLAAKINRDVDLVDLAKASAVLKAQVVGGGRCIFAASITVRDVFEMYVLSDYARTNEERHEVLATAGEMFRAG